MMYHFIICIILIIILLYFTINKNNSNCFISLTNYPELNKLKENYTTILEELNYILKNKLWSNYDDLHRKDIFKNNDENTIIKELEKSKSKIEEQTNEPKWKLYGLVLNKKVIEYNTIYCPKTVEILKSIPYVINAGFSCLEPNKSTDIHSDDNEMFYRYQLPIIIPKGDTGFKVNDCVIKYNANKPFIFDDNNLHQAWNKTDNIRIVLICDIIKKT